uniref:Hedgehog/Intein (Hint) domain-containing protein n=1 Tax=viral metagenome TaxID=1070528 RepID=A0A6C0J6T7_9ZZZZ
MNCQGYYQFYENSGNQLYDYYGKNHLIYYKSKLPLENWYNKNNSKGLLLNNYLTKKLDTIYDRSFTIFLKIRFLDNNLYIENKNYIIFNSLEPISNDKSFGILLKRIKNKYYYQIKLDDLCNNVCYYDIAELDKIDINQSHCLCVMWDENKMSFTTIFVSSNNIIEHKNLIIYNYSYDPTDEYFNGYMPDDDGIDVYTLEIKNITLGYKDIDNNTFLKSLITSFRIEPKIFNFSEILNFFNYDFIKFKKDYFNGSNYFDILNGFSLQDSTNSDNIHFKYNNNEKMCIFNTQGIQNYGHKKNNKSYLFTDNIDDFFYYKNIYNNEYSYSITFWIKGILKDNSTFFSMIFPTNNKEIITLDANIEYIDNKTYKYYIIIARRDIKHNIIKDSKIVHDIGIINNEYKWDYICICYDNFRNENFKGEIKTFLNSNIINNSKMLNDLELKKNTIIHLGVNSQKNKKFVGFMSGIQIYNYLIDIIQVEYNFKRLDNCYHPDTNILTDKGYINITKLKRGDMIKTLLSYKKLARLIITPVKNYGDDYIVFDVSSLGPHIPDRKLIITKGHPIYYKGNFYNPEDFVNNMTYNVYLNKINIKKLYHLQFEEHEIIYSNNLLTTSLPSNTIFLNLYLPKNLYFDKKKFNRNNIGKHYPPYFLHEDPIPLNKLDFDNNF